MRSALCLLALLCASTAFAADPPVASAAFRAQYVADYGPACMKAIEDKPDLRATYTHKTVEVYCTCRQNHRADMTEAAMKNNERGPAVADRAYEYALNKCKHILVQNLEKE